MLKRLYLIQFMLVGLIGYSCQKPPLPQEQIEWPFEEIPAKTSGISFINNVHNTQDFNIFLYRNFYNGGGVAIGDLNNDGLSDIYFTSNMGSNKLYINKGNFKFEDITEKAGVGCSDKWSTGVSLVDINADGYLDIYVCNAGYQKGNDQRNEFFINNGDLTFTEKAKEFNLDDNGYGTHAAFFDYDHDGDLDCYIVNNSFMPVNTLNYSNKRELPAEEWPVKDFLKGGGAKLLRNDNLKFVDVTKESGIYSSLIGFGLGITVGDVNEDGWDDMYISNDFFERDYLYINQRNGKFKESIKDYMKHLSTFSMGADMSDLNNDGHQDIFVTDMLPDDDYRLKTTSSFEDFRVYQLKLERDFYHQYMQNTLQLNNGNNTFSEVAHYSGVSASDWSWGALIFDINNDGLRDIYVSNGIFHDVTNQDFIDFFANETMFKMALSGEKAEVDQVINQMPSVPLKNKLFLNKGNLKFKDISASNKNTPSFSNGSAYGDLDNDGDLDLVVNNVNQPCFLLKNDSREKNSNHFLSIKLKGTGLNTRAIGSKIFIYSDTLLLHNELMPFRGFQSTVDYNNVYGLGSRQKVDSIIVVWHDGQTTLLKDLPVDTVLTIDYSSSEKQLMKTRKTSDRYFQLVENNFEAHVENNFIDFYNENLIIKMLSHEGPKAAIGDVNHDGKQDVFITSSQGQEGKLYLQTKTGFKQKEQKSFSSFKYIEGTAAILFDADQDDDLDLYVGAGGNSSYLGDNIFRNVLYLNNGNGNFSPSTTSVPINGYNTSVVINLDYDKDGDQDLFVGNRSIPQNYGTSPPSFLYENDGNGNLKNVTNEKAPMLKHLGMVTGAKLCDVVGDTTKELVVIGEWMAPRIFQITSEGFTEFKSNLNQYHGWWSAITSGDVDNDGDVDLVLGNRGENFYFTGTFKAPSKLWVYDFDKNGTMDKIITTNQNGKDVPVHLKKELTQQIVSLKKRNLKHADYATKSISDLFEKRDLEKASVKIGNYFKTCVAFNEGNGKFKVVELPYNVQFSSVNSILLNDINQDGFQDIIMAGNDSYFLPQYSKLDASNGLLLINKMGKEFIVEEKSGLTIDGDTRDMHVIDVGEQEYLLCLRNNEKAKFYRIIKKESSND